MANKAAAARWLKEADMKRSGNCSLSLLLSLALAVTVLTLWPAPALSQQAGPNVENLVINGGFEQGFQEQFGVAYGWGGFSNGSAVVGWNSETWEKAVAAGQYAQFFEIKQAKERDRYAGIYQTIHVVPGQQYKLTLKGLIRSEEGDISASDYGYRLQYAIDGDGGTAWELVNSDDWREIPWDEQPLYAPDEAVYRLDTFETTITASSDKLTLFIRGWKKWINDGSGVFNLDEISLVGPAPAAFQAPAAQAVAAGSSARPDPEEDTTGGEMAEQDRALNPEQSPVTAESILQSRLTPQETESALPVSGHGRDDSINYVLVAGVLLLAALFGNAFAATKRQRNSVE
jgi:hypothetical protein